MNVFIFGLGYVGLALARALVAGGHRVAGTVTGADKAGRLSQAGIVAHAFDGSAPLDPALFADASHIVSTVGPRKAAGADADAAAVDPVLRVHGGDIAASPAWLGYLSATSIYGDRGGALTDEGAATAPATDRGRARLMAEAQWREAGGTRCHIFRIAGIYGPGRSPFQALRAGRAKRVAKPGHVTNRIHVDDLVTVLVAAMSRADAPPIVNVADDDPAPSADVTAHAAHLIGVDPPPAVPLEAADLSPMAASFYGETKRVDNRLMKSALGVRLAYPSYREGLPAVLAAEGGHPGQNDGGAPSA